MSHLSGAVISECSKYRYLLWRCWMAPDETDRKFITWIMLNPSTADATQDDPTIRKIIKFSKDWGYGGIYVVNLFAYRATDPKELKKLSYLAAMGPENNNYVYEHVRKTGLTIAAWGQGGKLWGRDADVRSYAAYKKYNLHALKLSKDGTPYHPLYVKGDTKPFALEG